MNPRRLLPLTAVVLAFAGCGASAPPAASVLASATVEPVADAGADATLTISGKVDRTLRLGDDTLQSLATRTVTLYEPFEKRDMPFRVVALRDVLRLAGVRAGAETLHAVALNDYVVDVPLDVAAADGVYLAVANGDGSPIAVDSGGPIRIVFADGAEGAEVENYWIWSLASVTVR